MAAKARARNIPTTSPTLPATIVNQVPACIAAWVAWAPVEVVPVVDL